MLDESRIAERCYSPPLIQITTTLSERLAARKARAQAEIAAIEVCEKYLQENPSTTKFLDCLREIGM